MPCLSHAANLSRPVLPSGVSGLTAPLLNFPAGVIDNRRRNTVQIGSDGQE
jgi:hypothetical protein